MPAQMESKQQLHVPTRVLLPPTHSLLFSRLSAGGAAPQAAAIVAALAADGAAGDTECSVPARQE